MKKKVIIGIAVAIVVGLVIICDICFDGFSNVKAMLAGSDNIPIDCSVGPGTPEVADGYSYEEVGEEITR